MARPTILVAEPDPVQALSVRKLVLETAKFNVLTAHSALEAEEIASQFPQIGGVVLVNDKAFDCESLAKSLRKKLKHAPIIEVTAHSGQRCQAADHQVSSHEPEKLLELVRALLGDPRETQPAVKTAGARPRQKRA